MEAADAIMYMYIHVHVIQLTHVHVLYMSSIYSRGQKKLFPLHGTNGVLKRKRNGNETETKR